MQIIDMTGYQSGLLTVIKRDTTRKDNNGAYWLCQCECGTIREVRQQGLKSGKSQSCGCYKKIFGLKILVVRNLED